MRRRIAKHGPTPRIARAVGSGGTRRRAGTNGIGGSGVGRPYRDSCHDRPRSRCDASDTRPRPSWGRL